MFALKPKIINFVFPTRKHKKNTYMQIQRWQSVFLLIAFILMLLFCIFPVGEVQTADVSYSITTLSLNPIGEYTGVTPPAKVWTIGFFLCSVFATILPLVDIFLYRKPILQSRLCILEGVFLIFVVALNGYSAYFAVGHDEVHWYSMICAPYVSMIAVCAAYFGIKSDYRKIRSSERLR